jgi:hypothetical protein
VKKLHILGELGSKLLSEKIMERVKHQSLRIRQKEAGKELRRVNMLADIGLSSVGRSSSIPCSVSFSHIIFVAIQTLKGKGARRYVSRHLAVARCMVVSSALPVSP